MKIYIDENIPLKIATQLKAIGYEVEYVTHRVEDKDILETAYKQKALLIVLTMPKSVCLQGFLCSHVTYLTG